MGFQVGDEVTFSKTVAESDVYLFAGVTGDLAPNHVDAEYMAGTPYGRRVAHGVLVWATPPPSRRGRWNGPASTRSPTATTGCGSPRRSSSATP
ncbi:MaoC/PaaZ C-terminal domain-containing protein [Actinomadura vinacea]|uniref:MaoC/PaaZ C-terminal domain-containing protein n=1 Tax=Actinomadura vinacea TaxID=115336 RepID=UPI003CD09453